MTLGEQHTINTVHKIVQENSTAIQEIRQQLKVLTEESAAAKARTTANFERIFKVLQTLLPPEEQSDENIDPGFRSGSKQDSTKGATGNHELIKSIPPGVDDEKDSLELELIPQFFFVETEADDDCLDFEILIPSFFFDEEEDWPDELNFQSKEIMSSEVAKPKCSKELVISHSKLIGKTCFILLFDDSRIIFDPGKYFKLIRRFCYLAGLYEFGFDSITSCSFALYVCSILMDECDRNSVYELLFKNGYWADSWCGDSIVCSLTNGGVNCTAEMLFDKMSGSTVVNLSNTGVDLFRKLKMSRVFDRGKEINLFIWISCFPAPGSQFVHRMQVWLWDFLFIVLVISSDYGDNSQLLVHLLLTKFFTNSLLILLWMQIGGIHNVYKCLCGCEWMKFRMLVGITIQCCALLYVSPTCLLGLQFIPWAPLLLVSIYIMDHGRWVRSYLTSAGRVSSHLLNVVSSAAELVGIHVSTSMLLLTPSRSCLGFFRPSQIFEDRDTAVTVYQGVCKVQIRDPPSHVLLPSDAFSNCFAGLLMRAYIFTKMVSTHLLQILHSGGDSLGFRFFSPVASLSTGLRYFRLFDTCLFPHSPLLAPVIYATLVFQEAVDTIYQHEPVYDSGFLWVVYQPVRASTKLEFLEMLSGTQILLGVSQPINALLWVGYLKWKFILVPLVKFLYTDIIPQVTWKSKSRNVHDLPCRTLHHARRNSSCKGYLIWQLGYSLLAAIEMVHMESLKITINTHKQDDTPQILVERSICVPVFLPVSAFLNCIEDKVVHLTLDVQGLNYRHRVFDRGKGFQHMRRYSGFVMQWGTGDVSFYQMLNQMFRFGEKLSTQVTDILTAAWDVYLPQIVFLYSSLLKSEVFTRFATPERIILKVWQFLCCYLHTFYPAWYFAPCCKNLTALSILDSNEYYLPCYPAIWNGDSQLNEVLVFTHVMRRFAEIIEHLKFHGLLTVKSSIRSQLLGSKVIEGDLAYLFISEAKTVSATVPELRHFLPTVDNTIQVHSGASANCTEEKFRATPITSVSGDTLTSFWRQWQHWLLQQHLCIWSVVFLPEMKISVHPYAAMGTVVASAIIDYQAATFAAFRHVEQRAQMSSVPGLNIGKGQGSSTSYSRLLHKSFQLQRCLHCSVTANLSLAYGSTTAKGDSGQYNSGFKSSQLHRQAPK